MYTAVHLMQFRRPVGMLQLIVSVAFRYKFNQDSSHQFQAVQELNFILLQAIIQHWYEM